MVLISRPAIFVVPLIMLLCLRTSTVYADGNPESAPAATTSAQSDVCSGSTVPGGSWKVVHRSGPCVADGGARIDIEQIYRQESRRATYLQKQIRIANEAPNASSADPLPGSVRGVSLPARDGLVFSGGSYIVTIAVGTPAKPQTVIFDTGSGITWVQCEPCHPCYPQREPTFNPQASRTYRPVTCNDPACTNLPPQFRGCVNNTCAYRFRYDDGSFTAGLLAKDTLALTPSGNNFPGYVLGCGYENHVTFMGAAGMLGLSRGFHSVVTQTSRAYGNMFSYCLPSTYTGVGFLILGDSETPAGVPLFTPMLHNQRIPGLYFLELTGISVDNVRLVVPPTAFRSVGTIIDSGVTISRIPPTAYAELRRTFREGMRRRGHQELGTGVHTMDTCYSIPMPTFSHPNITLHFGTTSVPLSSLQVFDQPNVRATKYCLGFSSSPPGDISVLGTIQQRGMEVIYDLGRNRIGFFRDQGGRCH